MNDSADKYDIQFFQLVLSLQMAAMQQMGKVASPISGKIERDLNQAKSSIDLIEMIQKKTEGNLNEDEKKLIDHVLYELRMNYVEEVKKGDKPEEKPAEEPQQPTQEPAESQSRDTGQNEKS